jgi:hypothetical protein
VNKKSKKTNLEVIIMIAFTTRLTKEAEEQVWELWHEWLDATNNDNEHFDPEVGYTFDIAHYEERYPAYNKKELLRFVEGELNDGLNCNVFEGWGLGKDSTGKDWLGEVYKLYDKHLAKQDKERYALWDKQVKFYKQLVALAEDAGYVVKRQPADSSEFNLDPGYGLSLNDRTRDHDWDAELEGGYLSVAFRPFDFVICGKEVA